MAIRRNGRVDHPFDGGRETRTITLKHVPLIWENMLGTVYARDPATSRIEYFDYKFEEARAFAKVAECTDLRISRDHLSSHRVASKRWWNTDNAPGSANPGPGLKVALWGVPPTK
jgi:hypothetical protein